MLLSLIVIILYVNEGGVSWVNMPCFDDNIEPIHDTNDEVGMNVDEELVQCIEPIFYTDDEVDTTVNEELVYRAP